MPAYRQEKEVNENGTDMQNRLADLAAQIRLERGLNVRILSPKKSVFFKQNRFLKPDFETYEAIAATYNKLGKAGALKAAKYRAAADWIWQGDPK